MYILERILSKSDCKCPFMFDVRYSKGRRIQILFGVYQFLMQATNRAHTIMQKVHHGIHACMHACITHAWAHASYAYVLKAYVVKQLKSLLDEVMILARQKAMVMGSRTDDDCYVQLCDVQ